MESNWRLFLFQITIFLIFCFLGESKGQVIQTGNLFELYEGDYQKEIRISQRIQEQWNLPFDFVIHTHYNANKDSRLDSVTLVKEVYWSYFGKNSDILYSLELLDDGNHFDNEPNDGIYGNFLNSNFNDYKTDEAIIDILLDTTRTTGITGTRYSIVQLPVNYLPETPKIIAPLNQSIVSSETPDIYCEIDPNSDGYGLILLESIPTLGEELKNIIWEKENRANNGGIFTERMPMNLLNNNEYTLIVWSFTNNTQVNAGAYSIEWSQFKIDTLHKNERLVLSQNFPNPFNHRTIIKYNLPDTGNISLKFMILLVEK